MELESVDFEYSSVQASSRLHEIEYKKICCRKLEADKGKKQKKTFKSAEAIEREKQDSKWTYSKVIVNHD